MSGRACIGDVGFTDWHDQIKENIREKFVGETNSLHVTDDGLDVKVYYLALSTAAATEESPAGLSWHEQTMKRVRLLRLLFPNYETYGAQGIGMELMVGWAG